MKHLHHILLIIAVAISFASCNERGQAESGDLKVFDIDSQKRLFISGTAEEEKLFRITSRHNWEILEDRHFYCNPSSGEPGEEISIAISAKGSNNTTDTLFLDNLTIRLLSTRFVGITVYQLPRIKISSRNILLSGAEGSTSELRITTDADYTVRASEGAKFSLTDNGDGIVKVVATEEGCESERTLGEIQLWLNEAPESITTIKVSQRAYVVVPQTLICYMVGTSLGGYFSTNLKQLLSCVNNNILGDSRLLVLKTEPFGNATLYELRYDRQLGKGVQDIIKSVDLPTPYNASLLQSLLTEMLDIAPAEQYGLLIGSHGLGWVPKDYEPELNNNEDLRALFTTGKFTLWRQVEGALPTRHIGDGRVEVRFNTSEIAEAIKGTGRHFDYILFDACFMSSIEALYDMRDCCNYIISSPCEVMAAGFPYTKIMPQLLLEGGRSYDLDSVCAIYVDHYRTASTKSACVALTKCDELEALAATLKSVNSATTKPEFNLDSVQAYEGLNVNSNPAHVFYDLEDMVEQSCADEEAVEAFKAQLDKSILSRYHTEQFYSAYNGNYNDITHYSGVTTSARVELYAPVWIESAWYKATH